MFFTEESSGGTLFFFPPFFILAPKCECRCLRLYFTSLSSQNRMRPAIKHRSSSTLLDLSAASPLLGVQTPLNFSPDKTELDEPSLRYLQAKFPKERAQNAEDTSENDESFLDAETFNPEVNSYDLAFFSPSFRDLIDDYSEDPFWADKPSNLSLTPNLPKVHHGYPQRPLPLSLPILPTASFPQLSVPTSIHFGECEPLWTASRYVLFLKYHPCMPL